MPAEAALRSAGFEIGPAPDVEAEELLKWLGSHADRHSYLLLRPGAAPLLAARELGAELDVDVLHNELLPALGGELSFDAQPARLRQTLRDGGASLGILMNPVDPNRLFEAVQAGRVLPQKSTFFTPKVPSGLVVREF